MTSTRTPSSLQHPDQAVDLPRRRAELGHVAACVDLQRDQVRVVGDEGHQVELAEDADHRVALAHDHPVDAVPQHQQQRVEELVVGRDRQRLEGRDLAHRQLAAAACRPQQRVAQVGGGEDAEPVAVADQRVGAGRARRARGRG